MTVNRDEAGVEHREAGVRGGRGRAPGLDTADPADGGVDLAVHRLREAIERLADGFVIFDAEERLVVCNRRYLEIYHPASARWGPGTPLQAAARDAAIHCVGLEAEDEIEAWVQDRVRSHRNPQGWTEQALRGGRWIRVGEFPMPSGGSVGVRTDITELKRAQERARESEMRFRTLIEGSLQGVVVHRRWKPLYANRASAELLGYEGPEEILFLPSMRTVFAPYEHERLSGYGQARLSGDPAPDQYDVDVVRKDGSVITVRNLARRILWEGEPAVLSTLVDVTEQRRAEQALRQNEESLNAILNSLPVAVSVKDKHGRYMLVNRAYERLYGIVGASARGERPEDVLVESPAQTETRRAHEREVIESGTVMAREQELEDGAGSRRNVLIEKTPFLDATATVVGVCTAITDVTELKLAQRELARHRDHLEELVSERTRELRKTHNELLRSARLVTLGQLTATVSHELR
ncbi:MAG: PAS domain S-box protein, partial [Kiloniellales bacterium]|nr:PAS domain S-box protein [Kiloniellales bacterium]